MSIHNTMFTLPLQLKARLLSAATAIQPLCISHEKAIVDEVIALRVELDETPSTAVKVVDHEHTHYLTDIVKGLLNPPKGGNAGQVTIVTLACMLYVYAVIH